MADQQLPSTILRDSKEIYATIRESLKNKEPFDREVDFSRKNLRRRHLSLLLVHPYAKESENAETRLWMETSYAIIAAYKQALTRIDRAPQRQSQGQQTKDQSRHGPVEHRKLLQRFRQFLAEEEKFWAQFVVRYYRSFALDEAHPVLVTLGILSETEDPADETPPTNSRNHFQFPPSTSFAPTSPADRESRLTIMSKALVCLGDIARYREQYNESGGRSRVGPDEGGRRRPKRGGAPIADLPRPRNFDKARLCYQQAKVLTPHDGNPSHQLAIIASYEKDSFTSLVHYYRSLCVDHPYETASDNLGHLLNRALEHWKANGENTAPPEIAHVPKVLIEEFKKKVVLLHAFWRFGDARTDSLARQIASIFYRLVSDRYLPEDFINQLVTLAQGALWKFRMHQESSDAMDKFKPPPELSSTVLPPKVVEARLFTHLLSLYNVLLEVGIDKLKELPPMDSEQDLAQRLIVEFRRTLPAMRIAGKWLRANYKYVMSDPEAQGVLSKKGLAIEVLETPATISPASLETIEFWRKYAEFLRALSRAFPADLLPDLTFLLSEDAEMRGFKPLKGYMDRENDPKRDLGGSDDSVPRRESEVHPNDVQLMRIKDILGDARALVQMENSPLAIYGNQFVLRGVESQVQPIPTAILNNAISSVGHILELEDDAMTESTSNTDDAVLREAFEHLDKTDEEGDDDDGDEIVWDPKPSSPPDPSPVLSALVATMHLKNTPSPIIAPIAPPLPEKLTTSPTYSRPSVWSPGQAVSVPAPPLPSVDKTTAEDLLKGFMDPSRLQDLTKAKTPPDTSIPPPFLPGNNIWSASQDEQALRYTAASGPQTISPITPHMKQRNLSASQDFSSQQSIWPFPVNQYPQNHPPGLSSPSAFSNYPTFPVGSDSSHQRVPHASADAHFFHSNLSRNVGMGLAATGNVPHLSQLDQAGIGVNSYPRMHPDSLHNTFDTPQNFRPHARHLSFQSPSASAMPSMSSIWGNNG